MTAVFRVIGGGLTTFDDFFRSSKDRILRTVMVATGDQHDAEDCVSEALGKAFKAWDTVGQLESPAAWVVKVAVNAHIDRSRKHLRGIKLWPEMVRPDTSHYEYTPVDPQLIKAIRNLPERQREILAYRVLLELSAKETAQQLSISVATVGTHLHRALKTLREQLESSKGSD